MICVAWTPSALDVGKDLAHRVGRRTIGGDHHPTRLGVVDHRAEGLTELMGNRARQRRHRLAATGVGGERQVPPALDLGPSACAALVQEPDDQERLDGQHADGAQHRAPVFAATGSERDSARRCPAATGSRECPTAATRASRISVDPAVVAVRLMLPGGAPFKIRLATSAVLRARSSMDIIVPPTTP